MISVCAITQFFVIIQAKMRNKKVEKEKKDIESDIEIVKGIHSKLTLIFQKSSK